MLDCHSEINIYVCGPTTHDNIHVGNMRTFYFFSVVKRDFEFLGFKVNLLINMTDIEDKIIDASRRTCVPFVVLPQRYVSSCASTLKAMGVNAECMPKATEYLANMLHATSALLASQNAYRREDGIYCKVIADKYFYLKKQ